MKSFLILVLAVAGAVAQHDPGLRVKFNVGLRPGTDFFFEVPRTMSQAVIARWRLTPRPQGPLPSLALYCHADFTVCVYLDDTGNAAGLQIALETTTFSDNIYDMSATGFKEWEVTAVDGTLKKFWTIAMYFVSEEYLKLPAAEREASRNSTKFLQEDAVWATGYNGVVDKISVDEPELQNTVYTRQACIPWMGLHYYHKMRKDTECRVDTLYPWFLLTDYKKVMGLGFMVMGKKVIPPGRRDWFEHPPRLAISTQVKFRTGDYNYLIFIWTYSPPKGTPPLRDIDQTIVPNGPECLYDMANNPGVTTMHVYFINRPWGVGCSIFNK